MASMDQQKTKALVVIPTYNEAENIERIIEAVLKESDSLNVLVVDDNSPDGTAAIAASCAGRCPGRVHLLQRQGKQGLGTAYIAAFKWALERPEYTHIIEMDADFSHNPDDIPRLLEACNAGADVAVGSRYATGVNVVNWPMGRVLMSYYASVYVRIVTGMKVHDSTAGFVCWTRHVLQAMNLDEIRFKGYAFQIEMKFTATRLGFKIVEVPIIFVNRVLGESKMSSGIFKEGLFGVLSLKLASYFRKYERKSAD